MVTVFNVRETMKKQSLSQDIVKISIISQIKVNEILIINPIGVFTSRL